MILTITAGVSISVQPVGATLCSGTGSHTMTVTASSGGAGTLTYQWQSNTAGCGASFTDISGATTASYPTGALTQATYYQVVVGQTGSGCSAVTSACATVSVNLPPTANAGSDGSVCEGSSYTLSGTSAYNYLSLAWSTDGDGTFSGSTTLTPTYTPGADDLSAGSVILTLTANGKTPCDPATDDMTLTITLKPVVDAGSGGTTCEGKPFTISGASVTHAASYLWTAPGPGVLSDAGTLTPTYTPAAGQIGLVTLTLTATGNGTCNEVTDQAIIDFKASAVITSQPEGVTLCNGSSHTMSVVASAGGSTALAYQWRSNTAGCGDVFDPISGATTASYTAANVTATTYYQVRITQTGNDCDVLTSECATVTVAPAPVADAGPDQLLCNQFITILTGNWPSSGSTVKWTQISGPTVSIDPSTSPAATVTGMVASVTPYVFEYEVTANYPNSSCSATDRVTVTNYHFPSAAYAGPNQMLCITGGSTTAATLTGNSPAYGNGIWRQMSGPGAATIVTPANYTTAVTGLAAGTYVFSWGITNGVCDTVKDYVELKLYQAPTADAGVVSALICAGTSYGMVDATVANAESVYWTTDGDGSFNNPTTLHPTYTPGADDIANLSVVLTLHATGHEPCADATSSMTLNIRQGPVANAGPDANICETSTYCLCTASASTYTSITWEALVSIDPKEDATGTFSDIHALNPVYTPSQADIEAGCVWLVMHLGATAPCTEVTDTMKLCISRLPVAFAGADAMICEGFTYQITDATAIHQTGLQWTTSGTGTFDNVGMIHPTYTPSNADIVAGSVTLTLNLTACSPCPNVSDAMILTIHRNPAVTAYVVSNVSCYGVSDGIVSASVAGGTSPYTYYWSTSATTQTVSGLSAGTYSVTVTDNFGCKGTSSTTVTEPPLLTVDGTVAAHVRCKGGSDGAITITTAGGTPGYTYAWSNSATTQDISGLTAGTYSVTVTDTHSCTATGSWTVTEPDQLTVTGTVTHHVLCNGGSEGAISVTAGGGTPAYSFLWSNNATTAAISGLTAGTYSVTVTDAHTCVVSDIWTVTEPAVLTVTGSVTHHVLCKGGNDGAIAITTAGGTQAYSYVWSNNATSQDISGLTAGTYTVTVTDANTCVTTGSWTVTEPEALSITGLVTNISCYSYTNGAINVTYGGGVTPYSYLWSNSATTGSISGLSAGTYSVTVTDAHTCTLSESWTITEPVEWTVGITGPDALCCSPGGTPAQYCVTVGGAYTTPLSYQWVVIGGTLSGGANTNCIDVIWSCCGQGSVTVKVIKGDGCELFTSLPVTINPAPSPVITGPQMVTVGQVGTTYCTPDAPGHLFSWNVVGGTVTSGEGTNCITVTWSALCSPCNGLVMVYETYNNCTGADTLPVMIMPGEGNLTGYVTYDNTYGTGLNGVCLSLRNVATGTISGMTTTGPNTGSNNEPGYYSFSDVPNGTYRLTASYADAWGGNNATDALIVQLNVIGSYPLFWLRDSVADVNASLTKTALDALYIKLRTVGAIDTYPAGDWRFTDTTFTFNTAAVVGLKGLCVGDVNGSFIPIGYKDAFFLSADEEEVITIPAAEPFAYEISSKTAADLGAMTLFMSYDSDRFNVMEVIGAPEGMKYKLDESTLSLAWSDTRPMQVKPDDPLVTLKVLAKEPVYLPSAIFSLRPGSEFADIRASRFDNFELNMPKVASLNEPDDFRMYNYPNPFSEKTEIVYTIPEAGKVRLILTNMFGEVMSTLVEEDQSEGTYRVEVDQLDHHLAPGVYLYRIEVIGTSQTFTKVNKMMFLP
jgi:hypothetical protein